MMCAEKLDPREIRRILGHGSDARSLAISADRLKQSVVDRSRLERRLNERPTVPNGKFENVVFLYGAAACSIERLWSAVTRVSNRSPRTRAVDG